MDEYEILIKVCIVRNCGTEYFKRNFVHLVASNEYRSSEILNIIINEVCTNEKIINFTQKTCSTVIFNDVPKGLKHVTTKCSCHLQLFICI